MLKTAQLILNKSRFSSVTVTKRTFKMTEWISHMAMLFYQQKRDNINRKPGWDSGTKDVGDLFFYYQIPTFLALGHWMTDYVAHHHTLRQQQ